MAITCAAYPAQAWACCVRRCATPPRRTRRAWHRGPQNSSTRPSPSSSPRPIRGRPCTGPGISTTSASSCSTPKAGSAGNDASWGCTRRTSTWCPPKIFRWCAARWPTSSGARASFPTDILPRRSSRSWSNTRATSCSRWTPKRCTTSHSVSCGCRSGSAHACSYAGIRLTASCRASSSCRARSSTPTCACGSRACCRRRITAPPWSSRRSCPNRCWRASISRCARSRAMCPMWTWPSWKTASCRQRGAGRTTWPTPCSNAAAKNAATACCAAMPARFRRVSAKTTPRALPCAISN